jgi:hypothetical protein
MLFQKTNIGRLILESVMGGAVEKKASKRVDVSELRKVSSGLTKVAALPYKEDVYRSVQELVKTAAEYLDDAASELEGSLSRQAELEKAMEMRSLLDDMISYGILDPEEVEEKVAELSKKSAHEIEIVKTAVDMIKKGKNGSALFDMTKTASAETRTEKRGMFDNVI